MKHGRKNKFFKPSAVKAILNISTETLRYWRANLDPDKKRKYFTKRDVVVYLIFKIMIKAECVPVKKLKQFNWTPIFEKVNKASNSEIKNIVVVYDGLKNILYMDDKTNNIDTNNNWIKCVSIKNAIDYSIYKVSES